MALKHVWFCKLAVAVNLEASFAVILYWPSLGHFLAFAKCLCFSMFCQHSSGKAYGTVMIGEEMVKCIAFLEMKHSNGVYAFLRLALPLCCRIFWVCLLCHAMEQIVLLGNLVFLMAILFANQGGQQ